MPRRNSTEAVKAKARPARSGASLWTTAGPAIAAVVKRPALWGEGLRLVKRTAAPGWWKAWPPVPAPPADYLRFRLQTNSGGYGTNPVVRPHDLVDFLQWCRSNRHVLGH